MIIKNIDILKKFIVEIYPELLVITNDELKHFNYNELKNKKLIIFINCYEKNINELIYKDLNMISIGIFTTDIVVEKNLIFFDDIILSSDFKYILMRLDEIIKKIDLFIEKKKKYYLIKKGLDLSKIDRIKYENEVINSLFNIFEFRRLETLQHMIRVGKISKLIQKNIKNIDPFIIENIEIQQVFHDIGKIEIPDRILFKEGKLTEKEMKIVKKHTEFGYNILNNFSFPRLKLQQEIQLTHHERWNGSGYPKGLKGNEIPISGLIVGVQDSFDQIVSDRIYKKKKSLEEGFKEIKNLRNILYSPQVVDSFLEEKETIEYIYKNLLFELKYKSS